jgi:DNA-directed RNA polymerase specialized sigma24 family protein
VPASKQNLPQLYRFCFLMTGDAGKAGEVFQKTVREAELRAAHGEPPADRLWFFRSARDRCLDASEAGLQAEAVEFEEHELSPAAPQQLAQLDCDQLAIWISSAPEPQRAALALFYLDEFNLRELLSILGLKVTELAALLSSARRQFQAWLNATLPAEEG